MAALNAAFDSRPAMQQFNKLSAFECASTVTKSRVLVLGNLLCVDTPAVAVSWLLLFSNCFHLTISLGNIVALFLTVWLIYLIDRLVDSFSVQTDRPRSARQRFFSRNRGLWLSSILFVGLVDALIICTLEHTTVLRALFLGSVVLAYLTINWSFDKIWTAVPLKEATIGLLFATGTLLGLGFPIFALPLATLFAGGLFALLCAANCVAIATWERQLDRIQNKHSIATRFDGTLRLRCFLTVTLIIGSLYLVWIDFAGWPIALCTATSAGALIALDDIRVSRDQRTALADLVLLTPTIFLTIRVFCEL